MLPNVWVRAVLPVGGAALKYRFSLCWREEAPGLPMMLYCPQSFPGRPLSDSRYLKVALFL